MKLDDLGMLILTLKHKDSGFYLVEAPDNPTLDGLALKITAAMGLARKRTAEIDFSEMKARTGKSVTRFVREAVNENPDTRIFYFRNMGAILENDSARRFLINLNHAREGIHDLKRNFIFMVYPDTADLLRKHAPDLLSWIPHKYRFESEYATPREFAESVQLDENVHVVGDKDRKSIKELIELYEMQLDKSPDDEIYRIENILKPLADLYRLYGANSREVPVREEIVQFYKLAGSNKYANALVSLGTVYLNTLNGNSPDNIEKAITILQEALKLNTRENMPLDWANTMTLIGDAYRRRIRGDRVKNIEEAIRCYERAMEVKTRDGLPVEWAGTMVNLANAYSARIRGNRADNIEEAIGSYEQALEGLTRNAKPVEWANTMNNLANAYSSRIRGDRADNIEEAIRCYEQAMEVLTHDAMPVEWGVTKMNLANAYYTRIRGDRADNIEKAIRGYEEALEVTPRDAMSTKWVEARKNLAGAYNSRVRENCAENIEKAIR